MELDTEEYVEIVETICDCDDVSNAFREGICTAIKCLSRFVFKHSILQTQIALIEIKKLNQRLLSNATKQESIDVLKGIIAAVDFYIGSDIKVSAIPAKEQIELLITEVLIKQGYVRKWSKDQIRKKAEIIISYYAARNYCINGNVIESWPNVVKGWLSRSNYLPDVMDTAKVQEVFDSLK